MVFGAIGLAIALFLVERYVGWPAWLPEVNNLRQMR